MTDVPIQTDSIDLDQFLKLAGAAASGGEAKYLIGEGMVSVNGESESRRRRTLFAGDSVEVDGGGAFRVAKL